MNRTKERQIIFLPEKEECSPFKERETFLIREAFPSSGGRTPLPCKGECPFLRRNGTRPA